MSFLPGSREGGGGNENQLTFWHHLALVAVPALIAAVAPQVAHALLARSSKDEDEGRSKKETSKEKA